MGFAQLTYREVLRDIEACLRSLAEQAVSELPVSVIRAQSWEGAANRLPRTPTCSRLTDGADGEPNSTDESIRRTVVRKDKA